MAPATSDKGVVGGYGRGVILDDEGAARVGSEAGGDCWSHRDE